MGAIPTGPLLRGKREAGGFPLAPTMGAIFGDTRPQAPAECDWTKGLTTAPVFRNAGPGAWPCCTIAEEANTLRVITSTVWGQELIVPDDQVLDVFQKLGGTQTSGLYIRDVQAFMAREGFDLSPRQARYILSGHVVVDQKDFAAQRLAAWALGNVKYGMLLPSAAEDHIMNGGDWCFSEDYLASVAHLPEWQPGDGHCTMSARYDQEDNFYIETWGMQIRTSTPFLARYLDECCTSVSRLWLDNMGHAPTGLDLALLDRCMASIASA